MTLSPSGLRSRRGGFSLLEILVVIALLALIAAMVMAVVPGALDKDRASTAVAQLEAAMQISRSRAMRDGLPRGIRLIPQGAAPNFISTEYVYIESPPAFVANPGGPSGDSPYSTTTSPPASAGTNAPYVELLYTVAPQPGPPTPGSVMTRECRVLGLAADHVFQLQGCVGGYLRLPTLGTWHKIIGVVPPNTPPQNLTYTLVLLADYPDAQLGAATAWRTYHFGAYGPPRPLLGEGALPLPQKTCVDLRQSAAAAMTPIYSQPGYTGVDYDLLFAPGGQLMATAAVGGAEHVFLWVRDPDRPAPTPGRATPAPAGTPGSGFEPAGEQLLVVIKAKAGAIGWAPVDWGIDPYALARKSVAGN